MGILSPVAPSITAARGKKERKKEKLISLELLNKIKMLWNDDYDGKRDFKGRTINERSGSLLRAFLLYHCKQRKKERKKDMLIYIYN